MTTRMTEQQFIDRASAFLATRLGDGWTCDADTDLVASGVMDSLMMVEFFFFLEEQRGSAIDTEGFTTQSIASLRRAYEVVSAP